MAATRSEGTLKKWQHSVIRNGIMQYRENLTNYYIKNKAVVEVDLGSAFSLLSPPLGSAAARRRIRCIMDDMILNQEHVEGGQEVEWVSKTPHFTTIAVTYRCQCDCEHCSAYQYHQRVQREKSALTHEELKSLVHQAVDLGTTCLILSGGEPLLYDGIYELIAQVDPHQCVSTLFTNGEYLTPEVVKRLKDAGLFGAFVSLDHPDADRHDAHRHRPGIFARAVEGIKQCQDAGILTGISTYATQEKIDSGELDAMMELGKELGVLEVFVFDLIATGKLEDQPHCMLGSRGVEMIREFRRKYNQEYEYPRIIHQTMFTSIAYPCAAEGCPGGVAQMHIRGNGDVCPCDFTPLSFGNIREHSLAEVWQSIRDSEIYSQPSRGCRLADPRYRQILMAGSLADSRAATR